AITAFFALAHGHAHGAELPEAATPVAYALGFVVATAILHGVGLVAGLVLKTRGAVLVRALGGLVALGGAWFLIA
ncbi:HupE/UreJ family protein, partial [Klebsiella pneumoniae]